MSQKVSNMKQSDQIATTSRAEPSEFPKKELEIAVKRARKNKNLSKYWNDKVLEAEDKDPNRWKHSGYKALYNRIRSKSLNKRTTGSSSSVSSSPKRGSLSRKRQRRQRLSQSSNERRSSQLTRHRSPNACRKSPSMTKSKRRRSTSTEAPKAKNRLDAKRSRLINGRQNARISPPPKNRKSIHHTQKRNLQPSKVISSGSSDACCNLQRSRRGTRSISMDRPPKPLYYPPITPSKIKKKFRNNGLTRHIFKKESSSESSTKSVWSCKITVKPPITPEPSSDVVPVYVRPLHDRSRSRSFSVPRYKPLNTAGLSNPKSRKPVHIKTEPTEKKKKELSKMNTSYIHQQSENSEDSDSSSDNEPNRLTLSERFGRLARLSGTQKLPEGNLRISFGRDCRAVISAVDCPFSTIGIRSPPRSTSIEGVKERYLDYKVQGFLKDVSLNDYIKWEEYWLVYQEWLAADQAYSQYLDTYRARNGNRNGMY